MRVAFGPGADISSTSIRTYGTAKDCNTGKSSSSVLVDSDDDQSLPTLPEVGKDVSMEDATDVAPLQTVKQRYTECWVRTQTTTPPLPPSNSLYISYLLSLTKYLASLVLLQDSETTYYPTTLPLRKPNSGDPGSLFNGTFNNLNLVIHRSYDFCISKNVMMIFILISTLKCLPFACFSFRSP